MPQFELDGKHLPAFKSLNAFAQGYIEAAFFCDASPDSEDMADNGFIDLAPEALAKMVGDCAMFEATNEALLNLAYENDYDDAQAGRDFWFTRNHHGVGFWDRDELKGTLGEALTKAAHGWGETSLYCGDDGTVYAY